MTAAAASTSRCPVRTCAPRGLLDGDSGVELECVRGDPREHDRRCDELLDEALALGARGGRAGRARRAAPRPDSCAYGGGCKYPSICRCER